MKMLNRETATREEIIAALMLPGLPWFEKDLIEFTSTCWWWRGTIDHHQRPRVRFQGHQVSAHRAIWAYLFGPIPEENILCHHCDNTLCVNPLDIYLGTDATNVMDMIERGRAAWQIDPERWVAIGRALADRPRTTFGEANPRSRLSNAATLAIRCDKRKTKILAAEHGVHSSTIRRIRSGALRSAVQ